MVSSINPFTGIKIRDYETYDETARQDIVNICDQAFLIWRQTSQTYRCSLMQQLAISMGHEKEKLAYLITLEMGKPIRESISEIEKCIFLCEYYSKPEHIGLLSESLVVDNNNAMITYEPTGIIFSIMPWNFPFWQVFRFAIPNLMAGNVCLLKHAPNVTGCALAIEQLLLESGFPQNVFRTLIIDIDDVESIISDKRIKGVTLTGSAKAGSSVAALAGKYVKKSVLELGGSDPFLVFPDANLHQSCLIGARSRMINAGQVCIASKRFIVHESIFDQFIEIHQQAATAIGSWRPDEIYNRYWPLSKA
jgi:succinate-semialdehyde dehydrogenase / glutarate-semialdehyde dehydrogenase